MSAASLLQPAAVLVLDAGFAWLVGTLLTPCAPRLRHAETGAILACLAGSVVALWAATALMADAALPEAFGMLPAVMMQTAYGQAGLASIALVALLLARPRDWVAAVLLGLFALARASVSHAGEHGLFSVAVGVQWLHLVLIGAWLGCVGVGGWMVLPAAPGATYLSWLSRTATLALAGIMASGVFNAWQRLGAPGRLVDTSYGQILTLKLGLVAVALLLGACNRFVGFPAAARGNHGPAMMVLRFESLVLLGALGAAAVLASLQPPM